jgi:hypothetical protein
MGGFLLSLVTYRRLIFTLLFFPAVFVSLNACRQSPSEKSNALGDRVREFWERRIAGEDVKAYEYEEYSKTGSMTVSQYVQSRNPALRYKAYKIKEIAENGDEATVRVDTAYHLSMPARGQFDLATEVTEQWVRLDGQWYRQEQKKKDKSSPAQ